MIQKRRDFLLEENNEKVTAGQVQSMSDQSMSNMQNNWAGYDPNAQSNYAGYGYGQDVQGQWQSAAYDPNAQNNFAGYVYGQDMQGQWQSAAYDPNAQSNYACYGYGQDMQGQWQSSGYAQDAQSNYAAYSYGQNVQGMWQGQIQDQMQGQAQIQGWPQLQNQPQMQVSPQDQPQLQNQPQDNLNDQADTLDTLQKSHMVRKDAEKAAGSSDRQKFSAKKVIIISGSAVAAIAVFLVLMFTVGPFSARYKAKRAVDGYMADLKSGKYYADEYDEWYAEAKDSTFGGVALKVFGGTVDRSGINADNIKQISKCLAKDADYKIESATKVDSNRYKVEVKVTNKKLLSVGSLMLKKAGRDAAETMAEMAGENIFLGVDPKMLAMQFATTALYDFLQGDTIDSVMTMCEDSYKETEDTVTGTFDAYVERNGDTWEVIFDDVDQENDAVWTYYGFPAADRQSFKDQFNVKKWFE